MAASRLSIRFAALSSHARSTSSGRRRHRAGAGGALRGRVRPNEPGGALRYLLLLGILLSTWGLMWPWRVTSTTLPHTGQRTVLTARYTFSLDPGHQMLTFALSSLLEKRTAQPP